MDHVSTIGADGRQHGKQDPDQAARPGSAGTERSVDVEVLIDDVWWPGYLQPGDWERTTPGRWRCLVRFNTWASSDGPIDDGARQFDEDHIRAAVTTSILAPGDNP